MPFIEACREELTLGEEELDEIFVKEVEGSLVGFYSLQRISASHAELGYLFVEPSQMRQGHGKHLVADAIQRALATGYRTLVIQGDPHARDFYIGIGAEQIAVRESESIPGRLLPLFELDLTRR